jgi:hypothetical protein
MEYELGSGVAVIFGRRSKESKLNSDRGLSRKVTYKAGLLIHTILMLLFPEVFNG